jgi:outer membrane lipoprotein-sorting protein
MKRRSAPLLTVVLLVLLAGVAGAQSDAEADALLDRVAQRAAELQDASFLLTGRLVDPDGTEIALEIDVQTIPAERVASAYVLQPDALADNIIVLDGDTVANYTFLTNQVTLFDADDPDALGGLVGGGEDGALDVTFDLGRLFAGYIASLQGRTDTPEGPAERVRLDNVEEGAVIAWVEATIPDATLLPYRLTLHGEDDGLLAELRFEDLRLDQGLAAADVTFLPEDAEILDERASAPTGD